MTLATFKLLFWTCFLSYCLTGAWTAVAPPPWANPMLNPCANQPRGWQLLYWPDDGKCYKIFQKGYPCPEDMELSPEASGSGQQQKLNAQCKCPPNTAQSARDGRCYELFTTGPCEKYHYFAPDIARTTKDRREWGKCQMMESCSNINQLFWPKTGKCYERLTRGPCAKGQLLTMDSHGLSVCKCNNKQELTDYFYGQKHGCFEHFTKGPCKEVGQIFLPDKTCGCHTFLPHYHDDTDLCFEIGTIGPCAPGESFQLDSSRQKGVCACKTGHIRYESNGHCYRPFTQGPCEHHHILVNQTTCIRQPCERNHLYFPAEGRCYRIGSRGPCAPHQVVTFDFETRPSVDGISYNGLCACQNESKANCTASAVSESAERCDRETNTVMFREKCYKLYTQGPCARGAWIIPKRRDRKSVV